MQKKDFSFLNRSSVGCMVKTCLDPCSLFDSWVNGVLDKKYKVETVIMMLIEWLTWIHQVWSCCMWL